MEVRVYTRLVTRGERGEVETVPGKIYDLPGDVARHLIKLGHAGELKAVVQEVKREKKEVKAATRPVRRKNVKADNSANSVGSKPGGSKKSS